MSQHTPETKRLFIGGLFDGATPEDMKGRFEKYGIVKSVDMKIKKNDIGEVVNTFAFINFDSTPAKLRQFIDVFNKTKWKGKELKVQLAEESFIDRLERERKSIVKSWEPEKGKKETDINPHQVIRELKVKGPPGTPVEGKEGWVVGKYSQVVPVLKVKKDGCRRPIIFDPSKNCHALKRFDDDENIPEINIDKLTWRLEEKVTASHITSQKPSKQKVKRKRRKSATSDSSDDADSDSELDSSYDKKRSSKSMPRKQSNESVVRVEISSDVGETGENVAGGKYKSHSKLDSSSATLSKHQCRPSKDSCTLKSKIDFEDKLNNDDSDNDSNASRDSCDTDEIVRRSKGKLNSKRQSGIQSSQPLASSKTLATPKQDLKMKSGNDVTTRLVLSEFDDGLPSSSDEEEKESVDAGDTREDVFDLINNGKLDELLQEMFKKNSQHFVEKASLDKAANISVDIGKDFVGTKSPQMKKRKRVEPESSAKKKQRIDTNEDTQTPATANTDKIELKVLKKRKRSLVEEEDQTNKHDAGKRQSENVSSLLETSLDVGTPKKRKKILPGEENGKEISKKTVNQEQKNDLLKSSCIKEVNSDGSGSLTKQETSLKKTPARESTEYLAQSTSPVVSSKRNCSQVNILGFKDFQSFRYDPSAVDHEKFEIKENKEKDCLRKTSNLSPTKVEFNQNQTKTLQNDDSTKEPQMIAKNTTKKKTKILQNDDSTKEPQMIVKQPMKKKTKIIQNDDSTKESQMIAKNTTKKQKEATRVDKESSRKEVKTKKPEAQKSSTPELQKFCEVDDSVVDVFKATDDVPFSLDALFGGDERDLAEKETATKIGTGKWKKKKNVVVVEEDSDSDGYDNVPEAKSKSKATQKKVEGGFFYQSNDPRLKDSKFYREKDIDEVRQEWQEKRPHLVEAYRMKKKKPFRPFGKAPRPQAKKPQTQGKGFSRKGAFSKQ